MASNEFHGLAGSKLAMARRQLGGLGYDGMSRADGELTSRASNEGSRRLHNYGEGPIPVACLEQCLNSVLYVKVLVCAFNQEKALVGAFSVVGKSLRTFV